MMKSLTRRDFLKASGAGVGALSLLALTGCGSSSSSSTVEESSSEASSSSSETSSSSEAEVQESVSSDGFTASGHSFDAGTLDIYFMNEGKNYQKVLDKFEEETQDTLNTSINLLWTTDHATEMPLKFLAGEAGDITFDAYWINMSKNIEDGCYADISGYLNNSDYPGLQKVFTDDVIDAVRQDDGSVYCLPLIGSYTDLNGLLVRGDLIDKYGLERVTDKETLQAYLECIQEHKDEEGILAPFAGSSRGWFYFGYDKYTKGNNNIFEIDGTGARATQCFEVAVSEDGTTVLGAATVMDDDSAFENFPEGWNYNYRNELIKELGSVWGQYVAEDPLNIESANDKAYAGMYAVVDGNLGALSTATANLQANIPDAYFDIYLYETEMYNMTEATMNVSPANNFICFPADSDNLDRAMAFIDWIYLSQENYDLFAYGIEGEDFEATGDSTYEYIQSEGRYDFPTYELAMCTNYGRVDSSLSEEMQEYMLFAMDETKFRGNPIAGFVFNSSENSELKQAYAAYSTLQQDYYSYFMCGSYGDETEAMMEEFHDKAIGYMDIIRENLISQLQEFLDARN